MGVKVTEMFGGLGVKQDDTHLVCKPCGEAGGTHYQQVIVPAQECAVCHKFQSITYRYLKPNNINNVNTDKFTCNRCSEPFEVCQCF